MNDSQDKHRFAFYTPIVKFIAEHKSNSDLQKIDDPELVWRILTVLRLEKGEKIIIFDSFYHIDCFIFGFETKKSLIIEIVKIEKNQELKPDIVWLLPLLKKESFEEAIYTLTELGVNEIQPLTTSKSRRASDNDKLTDRNKKIIIAAAEQSKQFVLPLLQPVVSLEMWIQKKSNLFIENKIFFDANGLDFNNLVNKLNLNKNKLVILSGPEGDLSKEEKLLIQAAGFASYSLTKTILRAQQAVAVGLGTIRTILN